MGQITKETIAMMRRAVEAGQAPPLTLWEYSQLAHLAEKQLAQAKPEQAHHMTEHKQGCEALGGYGHGIGVCSCGFDPKPKD